MLKIVFDCLTIKGKFVGCMGALVELLIVRIIELFSEVFVDSVHKEV